MTFRAVLVLCLFAFSLPASAKDFVHPGMLHSRADLDFVKAKIASGEEPWKTAWAQLGQSKLASLKWTPRPIATVVRGVSNNPDIGSSALSADSAAAYCHALQWALAGERAHADKAIEILNAWSGTLKSLEGHDRKLLAGITAHKFANAAEILCYTDSGWKPPDIERFKRMLLDVYAPVMKDFFPSANGNWDASMIDSSLCIAVFCDDHAMFDRSIDYALHGPGHGAIPHYVYPTGQCQESTRDQAHTQLGLGFLAGTCQVAWTQGIDLFGADDNRLAIGFEYTAKYNLGEDVPCEGTISPKVRGKFQPIYELIYRHYAIDKGIAMPYTKRVAEKTRPEGPDRDQSGWETLMFFKAP